MSMFSKMFKKDEASRISDDELVSKYHMEPELVNYIHREIRGEIGQLKGFTIVLFI